MTTNDYAIRIYNVSKSFDSHKLFDDLSLNIRSNTIHAIIGPNGSGKTSLLRILTGLYEVDSGKIEVKGNHCMLLENDYLYEDKSGMENLKIFGLYFGFDASKYEKYANMLGLTDHLSKRVSTYSKGMKRKLSLLIVVLMDRDIMLFDEPTSGVDPISRIEIRTIIERMRDEHKTVLITSHDLSEIEKTADYVTMIKDGTLLFEKSMNEVQKGTLEELFVKAGS